MPKGRWTPFLLLLEVGLPIYFRCDSEGRVCGFTLDGSEAWALDRLLSDEEAIGFARRFDVGREEVLALGDNERELVYEFRGYGFRLYEGDLGGSHERLQ